MTFIHAYLCWFIFITSYAAGLKPPRNVIITTSGNNVTVTWTLPGESEIFTYLTFYSSGRMEKGAYIKPPRVSYAVILESCKKYRLDMLCFYSNSGQSEKVVTTFWVTDNIFYSNINTDINIMWKTSLGHFYSVQSPSNRTIYHVIGNIVPNTDMNKYKINSKGIEQIDISVLNVSQNDSGIYQSVSFSDSSNVDGCCLLIIIVHPQTPVNFSLVSSTETSILVEWTPAYNDNNEQTFYLEYRVRGAKIWSLKEIYHNTKQLNSLTYVLSGLQDSTLYELKMFSKHMYGRSLSTDIDSIQTKKQQDKETSSSGLYTVIGGVAGVIAVLIIIMIILKRKKGWSGGTRNNISNRSDNIDEMSSPNGIANEMYENTREGPSGTRNKGWSGGTRNNISNRSDNIDEMSSPNRTSNDMYEEIREGTSDTRNEDLQERAGYISTRTYEMLGMKDTPNTYNDLSSGQEQRQSESTTEQDKTLGEQDKPNAEEQIKNKQEPEDREYIN